MLIHNSRHIVIPSMLGLRVQTPRGTVATAWTPASATDDGGYTPIGWWKADVITGLSNGDSSGSWLDSSGNSNTASELISGDSPIYNTNVINGLPALTPNSTEDRLLTPAMTIGTVCAVVKFTAVTNYGAFIEADTGNATRAFRLLNTTNWYHDNANDFGTRTTININGVQTYAATSDTWQVVSDISRAVPSSAQAYLFNSYFRQRYWEGSVAEIVAYSQLLSDADRAQVDDYLMAKYAIS